MEKYSPLVFDQMIGRSVSTFQRRGREGLLEAYRSFANRRYYTHDDYPTVIGQKPKASPGLWATYGYSAQKLDLANTAYLT